MRNDIRLFYTQVSQKTIKQSVIKLKLLDYLFNNLQPVKARYVKSVENVVKGFIQILLQVFYMEAIE